MKKTAVFGMGLMLVAGSALASNTGFKLNYPLVFNGSGSNNNWLSVPYFYFPNGNVGQTGQNSLDICRDLNGGAGTGKVTQVIRFLTATDLPKVQPCSSPLKAFDFVTGEGYSVKPAAASITVDIVGSHDDSYAPNKTATPTLYALTFNGAGSNNNWFSMPYHSKANNSLDFCAEMTTRLGAGKITQIIRFLTATDLPKVQPCSSPLKAFDLVPGEGYSVKPAEAGLSIGVDVY